MTASNRPLPPSPKKVWDYRPLDLEKARKIASEFNMLPLTARLLAVRELEDSEAIRNFLSPALASLHDPMDLPDMDRAVQRIAQALENGEQIAVYGDYDVDGLTATTLLVRFFKWLGVQVETYIPHRLDEGYGMSRKGVDCLHGAGAKLIVTVDNGISCLDEVAYAASLGIDVIVTDHHQPESALPQAVAVVNPHLENSKYPFKELSGCGVAFKLVHALAKHLADMGFGNVTAETAKPFLLSQMDLVAMGTIADIMPLLDENRVIARYGLAQLEKTNKAGLVALGNLLGVFGKPVSSETVGFVFGPRLNAAGRTGNAVDALELLLTEDETRSWELAKFLDQLNQERRVLESGVLNEAIEMIEEDPGLVEGPVLVLACEGWHQGVVGIVASRLVERFGRPALILTIEEGLAKGSARGIDGFDLLAALTSCKSLLSEFGGHKMAAGLSLKTENIDAFRDRINREVAKKYDPEQMAPRLLIDTTAAPEELTFQTLEEINRLRPFGQGNPNPLIALKGCRLAAAPYEIGGKHLKLRIQKQPSANGANASNSSNRHSNDTLTALWFHYPHPHRDILAMLQSPGTFDIAGSPKINVWNGQESVEFTIKDVRPSS